MVNNKGKQKDQLVDLQRRGFLRAAGGAGALGALAGAAGHSPPATAAAAPVTAEPPGAAGYHETEHIRQYYRSARYW